MAAKDFFTIIISILSLCISLYQFWESRRKKIKISFQPHIEIKDDILTHFLIFSIVNIGSSTVHIYDTRFYLYEKRKKWSLFKFWNTLLPEKKQVYFSTTVGHLCDEPLEIDKVNKMTIEAYEIFSNYFMKGKQVNAVKVELIDMDGRKFKKKVLLGQHEHDESRDRFKIFCFPLKFYKYEDKMRKKKKGSKGT